jgi:GLPGLI family protein
MSEPKERVIEAWYTMEIPVSNGPGKYWGLPGLILELHEGETTFLCSKIVLNPEEKVEIKAPKNGKKVSQKEFDAIQEKKIKSMTNGDGVIEIKMN